MVLRHDQAADLVRHRGLFEQHGRGVLIWRNIARIVGGNDAEIVNNDIAGDFGVEVDVGKKIYRRAGSECFDLARTHVRWNGDGIAGAADQREDRRFLPGEAYEVFHRHRRPIERERRIAARGIGLDQPIIIDNAISRERAVGNIEDITRSDLEIADDPRHGSGWDIVDRHRDRAQRIDYDILPRSFLISRH